jgi:hypothetical protein
MASGGRQGAGEAGGEVAAFRAAAPDVSIARLPQTTTRLFGRDADLAWLEACWAERAHVATIVAWGGVGKSALVNAWLARLRDGGWGGAARVYRWSFYSQGTDRQTSADAFIEEAEEIQRTWQPSHPLLYALQGFRHCDILLDQGREIEVQKRAAQTLSWVESRGFLLIHCP